MKEQPKPQVPTTRPALRPWLVDVPIEHLR
jgi:hypothetical protein